jgi:uncharacterized hydrophobic protein (TIGR00271 family)
MQDRVAATFGIAPDDRAASVKTMLAEAGGRRASYWLELLLAIAIATFGLVTGSAAVIIGAMLISPLMGPIVKLGMGLAVGSPFLVTRSLVRVLSSIAVAILGGAAITLLIPFHEVTAEIAARTSPTVIDLLVAVCCAIAAAYAVSRPGSDTTATAAGTAIGIALVPPLCVVGYGVGTRAPQIARGAVASFLLLGYGQVHVPELEAVELSDRQVGGLAATVARWLDRVFSSSYGLVLRVVMPVLLVVAVYVPLRTSLDEVTWQVRVRAAIEQMIAKIPQESVEDLVEVARHHIDVRLILVGREEDSETLQADLSTRIEALSGVKPLVQVIAVPDAQALKQMEAIVRTFSHGPSREFRRTMMAGTGPWADGGAPDAGE